MEAALRIWVVALALVACWVHPAWAQRDPVAIFPVAIFDAACTDDYDTPAASTRYAAQTSGSADGLCDGDTNVKTGTFSEDTSSSEIIGAHYRSMYVYVDADTVGGGTPTWKVCIEQYRPGLGTYSGNYACSAEKSGTGAGFVGFGPLYVSSGSDFIDGSAVALPPRFKIKLQLESATTWAGSLSLTPLE